MKPSNILISKIKEFESLRLKAYKDSVGIPTIGWGHTLGVKMGMVITEEQAERFLIEDLQPKVNYVNSINKPFTQGQFDALVDFSYNLGIDALMHSTLLKRIMDNAPYPEIKKQFLRWSYANGKVLNGLVNRRNWEAKRYLET